MLRPVALLLLTLLGCASSPDAVEERPHQTEARDLAFTHTYEVRFGSNESVAGYFVEFFNVPEGVVDRRLYPTGTALVQDLDLETVGFITPSGRAYAFDEHGNAVDLGYDGRHDHVAKLLGVAGKPQFTSTTPYLPTSS